MPRILAACSIVLLVVLVVTRVILLKHRGISAMRFGAMDKRDFLIPPFVLFLLYLIFSGAFGWPTVGMELFHSTAIAWVGVALCAVGLALFARALVSFGKSFRVGLDEEHPGSLVTTGAFALSRNPIYVAFGLVLSGIFLAITNFIILLYLLAGGWLINRQVKLEEASLRKIYGGEYEAYCKKVRRFL